MSTKFLILSVQNHPMSTVTLEDRVKKWMHNFAQKCHLLPFDLPQRFFHSQIKYQMSFNFYHKHRLNHTKFPKIRRHKMFNSRFSRLWRIFIRLCKETKTKNKLTHKTSRKLTKIASFERFSDGVPVMNFLHHVFL